MELIEEIVHLNEESDLVEESKREEEDSHEEWKREEGDLAVE